MAPRPLCILRLTLGCGESLLGLAVLQWPSPRQASRHPPGKREAYPLRVVFDEKGTDSRDVSDRWQPLVVS